MEEISHNPSGSKRQEIRYSGRPHKADRQLLVYEDEYGKVAEDVTVDDHFVSLIRNMSKKTGERVVILIDEYDKPLFQAIGNDSL